MPNLKPHDFQFVFFPQNFNLDETLRADFLAETTKSIPGKSIILPVPNDIPNDIPFMFLQLDEEYEIQFSKNRISISVPAKDENNLLTTNVKPIIKKIFEQLENRLITLKDIGCVIRNVEKNDEEPNKIISAFVGNNSFINPARDAENFIKNVEKIKLDLNGESKIFNISRMLNTGAIEIGNGKRILVCEFDINTFPEINKGGWTWNLIEKFIENIESLNGKFIDSVNAITYE